MLKKDMIKIWDQDEIDQVKKYCDLSFASTLDVGDYAGFLAEAVEQIEFLITDRYARFDEAVKTGVCEICKETAVKECDRLNAELLAAKNDSRLCRWVNDDDGVWHSECGESWEFIEGGPVENRTRFCHYCGGGVVVVTIGVPVGGDIISPADWDNFEAALRSIRRGDNGQSEG